MRLSFLSLLVVSSCATWSPLSRPPVAATCDELRIEESARFLGVGPGAQLQVDGRGQPHVFWATTRYEPRLGYLSTWRHAAVVGGWWRDQAIALERPSTGQLWTARAGDAVALRIVDAVPPNTASLVIGPPFRPVATFPPGAASWLVARDGRVYAASVEGLTARVFALDGDRFRELGARELEASRLAVEPGETGLGEVTRYALAESAAGLALEVDRAVHAPLFSKPKVAAGPLDPQVPQPPDTADPLVQRTAPPPVRTVYRGLEGTWAAERVAPLPGFAPRVEDQHGLVRLVDVGPAVELARNSSGVRGCGEPDPVSASHPQAGDTCRAHDQVFHYVNATVAVRSSLARDVVVVGTEWTVTSRARWREPVCGNDRSSPGWTRDFSVGHGALLIAHVRDGKPTRQVLFENVRFDELPAITAQADAHGRVHVLARDGNTAHYVRLGCGP